MSYRVRLLRAVNDAIDAQLRYYAQQGASQDVMTKWLHDLLDQIELLERMPKRFPVAEAASKQQGHEVRRVNWGEHAVFYRVDDEAMTVYIIAVRHGRRRPWEDDAGASEGSDAGPL